MTTSIRALRWDGEALWLLDQRRLPLQEVWLRCTQTADVHGAIADLAVRGAPAIGVAAAFAMALATRTTSDLGDLAVAAETLRGARPTAVNLAWAVDRVLARVCAVPQAERAAAAAAEAETIRAEDEAACAAMGGYGADLVPGRSPVEVLTHCNAGALATAGIGTALGVVRELHARGRLTRLWAGETRPVLQGARLTAWEAMRDGLPVTLVSDTAVGTLMATRPIAAVIVGADRIAADGSTANKVGTYTLAVLAHRHVVPFLVVAPTSTVDLAVPTGAGIPIEERDPDEVRRVLGGQAAPLGVDVFNPAFDVTPPELIAAIVTERGVARPPFEADLVSLAGPR